MRTICRFWVAHLTEIMGNEHMNDEVEEGDDDAAEGEWKSGNILCWIKDIEMKR